MRRREFIALLGSATAAAPCAARAEAVQCPEGANEDHTAVPIAARLVGAWGFVSSTNTRADGSSFDRWGPDPIGTFMFDGNGHFAQVIMGPESRLFGAKNYFAFGKYSIDEAAKTIVTKIKGSSISKLNGTVQRRFVTALTADELRYINDTTASGNSVDASWRRLK